MSPGPERPGASRGPGGRPYEHVPGRRLFVAVPLPEDVRDAVVGMVERVRAEIAGAPGLAPREVRWVRLEGLHITLRFLGPTPDERIPAIESAMRAAAGGVASFPVRIEGAGAFPSPGRPRVLWLGVTEGAGRLAELAALLEDGLARAGWARDERPFAAHLTLARSDGVRAGPKTARALAAAAEGFVGDWRADRLVLFESHTGGGPARYEPLIEVPLTGQVAGPPTVRSSTPRGRSLC